MVSAPAWCSGFVTSSYLVFFPTTAFNFQPLPLGRDISKSLGGRSVRAGFSGHPAQSCSNSLTQAAVLVSRTRERSSLLSPPGFWMLFSSIATTWCPPQRSKHTQDGKPPLYRFGVRRAPKQLCRCLTPTLYPITKNSSSLQIMGLRIQSERLAKRYA